MLLDAHFLHLYFYQSLPTLQCGLSAIADLLVVFLLGSVNYTCSFAMFTSYFGGEKYLYEPVALPGFVARRDKD